MNTTKHSLANVDVLEAIVEVEVVLAKEVEDSLQLVDTIIKAPVQTIPRKKKLKQLNNTKKRMIN